MTTYNLEETQDTFISPFYLNNIFLYRMVRFKDESNFEIIRDIDLRKDKLIIHETEIKESMLQNMYDCLCLRQDIVGKIYVNCNGACYIVAKGKIYRPNDNAIFDWSRFGVIIPNSAIDISRKQVQDNEEKLSAMKIEFEVKKTEFKGKMTEFETTQKEVKSLHDQLCNSKKENEEMKAKIQNMEDQICLYEEKLSALKIELETSNKNMKELEDIVKELHESIKILFFFDEKEELSKDQTFDKCYVIKGIEIDEE
ncbi:unnamed protein product [Amaranthus hypochondriacus]